MKTILLGCLLALGCAGEADQERTMHAVVGDVATTSISMTPDGRVLCDDGEEKAVHTIFEVEDTGVGTGQYAIPDSRSVRWKFSGSGWTTEAQTYIRAGLANFFAQGWATYQAPHWTQSEVTGTADVVFTADVTHTPACQSPGAGGDTTNCWWGSGGPTDSGCASLGTLNGNVYKECPAGTVSFAINNIIDRIHAQAAIFLITGYTEAAVRENAFWQVAQHEMAHNLGVNHSYCSNSGNPNGHPSCTSSSQSQDLVNGFNQNDAFLPIVGVDGRGANNSGDYKLTNCAWDRLALLQPNSSGAPYTVVFVGPLPDPTGGIRCPTRNWQ